MAVWFGSGTPWAHCLLVGTISLVAGVVLLVFPDPSVSRICVPGFIVIGIVFLGAGLLIGYLAKWKP